MRSRAANVPIDQRPDRDQNQHRSRHVGAGHAAHRHAGGPERIGRSRDQGLAPAPDSGGEPVNRPSPDPAQHGPEHQLHGQKPAAQPLHQRRSHHVAGHVHELGVERAVLQQVGGGLQIHGEVADRFAGDQQDPEDAHGDRERNDEKSPHERAWIQPPRGPERQPDQCFAGVTPSAACVLASRGKTWFFHRA